MEYSEALEIFEIDKMIDDISSQQLKKKYHKLALKYHPDKNICNCEKMQEINMAYQILLDRQTNIEEFYRFENGFNKFEEDFEKRFDKFEKRFDKFEKGFENFLEKVIIFLKIFITLFFLLFFTITFFSLYILFI